MRNSSLVIAKNFIVLILSQVFTWLIGLVLTIYLSRYLGPDGVGKLHLANSLWAMVTIFATFGMETYLIKEIARSPHKTGELFWLSVALRLILFAIGGTALVLMTRAAGYLPETVMVILVIGVGYIVHQVTITCEAVLKGMERMEFVSAGSITAKLVSTLSTIVLLTLGFGVIPAASVGILATSANLVILVRAIRKFDPLTFRIDWSQAFGMLKSSFPFVVMYLFLVFYEQIDAVIISLLVDEHGVGLYGATDQLFGTLLFAPSVFITAVLPALSRSYGVSPEARDRLFKKSYNLLMLVSVPVGIGTLVLASQLVVLLFGEEFVRSGQILVFRAPVLILTYMNMLIGIYFISTDRQKPWTVVIAIATVLTIPLDLVFVPFAQRLFTNGAVGGAFSYILTETFMFAAGLYLLPKGMLGRENAVLAVRVLAAGVGMGAVVWICRNLWLPLPILAGIASFAGLSFLLRLISTEDIDLIKSAVKGYLASRVKGEVSTTGVQ